MTRASPCDGARSARANGLAILGALSKAAKKPRSPRTNLCVPADCMNCWPGIVRPLRECAALRQAITRQQGDAARAPPLTHLDCCIALQSVGHSKQVAGNTRPRRPWSAVRAISCSACNRKSPTTLRALEHAPRCQSAVRALSELATNELAASPARLLSPPRRLSPLIGRKTTRAGLAAARCRHQRSRQVPLHSRCQRHPLQTGRPSAPA